MSSLKNNQILPLFYLFSFFVLSNQKTTLEDVYQQFNQNELNSRTAFELVYNECKNLRAQLQNANAQINQLTTEKTEWQKVKDKKEKAPEIKK